MTNEEIKEKLIIAGVKNLKSFGYEYVNKDTILTDEIYSAFFVAMLKDTLGNGKQIDEVVNQILEELKSK